MNRSARLAAALAKAQAELVNPEKSLVATIRSDGRSGTNRRFAMRRCPAGLISCARLWASTRSLPCRRPSIDQAAGIVNLTTVLAHSSGEWIASDWPVCPISDTATPHRMGEALTYARRYALFTLVGIAGEDDLDAPDLTTPTQPESRPKQPTENSRSAERQATHSSQANTVRHQGPFAAPNHRLDPTHRRSYAIGFLPKSTTLAPATTPQYGHTDASEKNKLIAADAQRVEEIFQTKLATFANSAESPTTSRN